MTETADLSQERRDLLETLRLHRWFLRHTVQGLTEEQARTRSTVSELTLGGLVKHVAATEAGWIDFVLEGPAGDGRAGGRRLLGVGGQLPARRRRDARRRPRALRRGRGPDRRPGRDRRPGPRWPLPAAPWFEPGATRSARRVFLHVVAETAQHAGHADIIREAIDGQKTMG